MKNPFELKGYWWLPDCEEAKLTGTLTYSQDEGAILDVVGLFDEEKTKPTKDLSIILGVTQQGKPVTLYKCIVKSWSYPLVGLGGSRYLAHFVFEGVHFQSVENIKFHELRGSYTDLDSWVGIYGFTIEQDYADKKTKITYKLPESKNYDIGDTFEVGINFTSRGPNYSIVQTDVTISQNVYLSVKSKNVDINFHAIFDLLNKFLYLLQFGVQRIPYTISLLGFSKENQEEGSDGKIYYPQINIYFIPIEPIENRKERIPQEFLYTFADLSSEQIVTWFTVFNKYETIIHLYRSLFYKDRLFIDTKFLNIVQSLESLHSILFDGQYLPNDKFGEQKKKVLEFIPSELSKWVEDALGNANYKRMRQKIFELLDNKKEFVEKLIEDIDIFAKRVTGTRNNFVHHNKQNSIFSKEELPSVIFILILVLELYLLEIIGFSNEKVKELVEPKIQTHITGWNHLRTTRK